MNNIISIPQSGERLSFFKLFKEKGYSIEIPLIQRDYAFGRETSKEKRELFLDALYDYLKKNKPNRDLDFVYGSLANFGIAKFIPLDGQQRLTTLFLLHWYLANISGKIKVFREFIMDKNKSRFTYETRPSSKEFCDALLLNETDIANLLPPDEEKQNALSKTIKDSGWYYLSWGYDPTIQSMLNMLDSIHAKFSGNPEYFDRLINDQNPVITFLFLNLVEFKLTDDLYIKMNSRGRPLTQWENFKAKFEQYLDSDPLFAGVRYKLTLGNETRDVHIREYFSHMIDTSWANLFWNYRGLVNYDTNNKEGDIDDSFDNELMNFMRVIFADQFASDCDDNKDEKLEILIGTQVARGKKDYTDNFTFYKYQGLGVLSDKLITYLISALNALTNGENKIKIHLPDIFYFDENKVFENTLMHDTKFTFVQRVQFHAYLKYLTENKNTSGVYEWMRVIRNLTANTPFDGSDDVAKAIKSINKLLPFSCDILTFLKSKTADIDFFTGSQVYEERLKSHLITKSTQWTNAIRDIELHSYFTGQVGFILYFSEILEYFMEHENCDWSDERDRYFLESFLIYSKKAGEVFTMINKGLNKNFHWERAVLTKGDYLKQASQDRYNFLSVNSRDYGWKRFLNLPQGDPDGEGLESWKPSRDFVKEVFDDTDFDPADVVSSLKKIIKARPSDWRGYFIENPELIRYCKQGFIRFCDDSGSDILLYKESQLNHKHRELYSYDLYVKYFKDMNEYAPFTECQHLEAKGSEEKSYLRIFGWCLDRIYFELKVLFNPEDINFTNPWIIIFAKSKGSQNRIDYPENVISAAENSGFVWDENQRGFMVFSKNEGKTIRRIKDLCQVLNAL